jgi:hypothetical protein
MRNQSKILFCCKLTVLYVLAKLKFLHVLLPKELKNELPIDWNNRMFWTAFQSGGQKIYFDYYSELKKPVSYEPKIKVDSELQLTEKDLKFFYDNGYLGPFDLIDPDEAKALQEHLVNLYNKESKIYSYSRGDYEFDDPTDPDLAKVIQLESVKRQGHDRHLEDPTLLNLFKRPEITERCAQLLGSDLILWYSQFFQKPPHSNKTELHQESTWLSFDQKRSILHPEDSEELFQVSCWIALTDATKYNGCMTVVPGSHWEIYPVQLSTAQTTTGYGAYQGTLCYPIDEQKVNLIEMKAGQFFIFTERVIHGSVDNVSDDWRWAVNGRIAKTNTKVFTKEMLEENLEISIYRIKKFKLDNWKAVLLRGQDSFGYNRLFE